MNIDQYKRIRNNNFEGCSKEVDITKNRMEFLDKIMNGDLKQYINQDIIKEIKSKRESIDLLNRILDKIDLEKIILNKEHLLKVFNNNKDIENYIMLSELILKYK
ncbi:hypothetical protein [Flammeovirga kamogawensis]|uniref:Uncharacterized protein n=1 Tax=Flammeovirga kamogawensis TaxID=373891 RepID=A0ABX8H145_9BACT|nr:hypothetical protein [Flammeovirga kamogawensis]MBB6462258.1 hypothetical protein [Flammeovirga kamogawensis]QWG09344.1 hypothetical protein KM029_22320 [Flammeovirga kamogawensis]TRX64866.1 hypothetical protein EO216_20230 [Flammeovirga kamogawensis]